MVFHVINRGVGRQQLFFNDDDYLAFERVIRETLEKRAMRILSYCLMPNHWHFTLWPERDGDLGKFMQLLTVTHVTRWQTNYNMVGYGHLYQGRFKSFPVETDDYFYQVNRYVERNALRANLVTKARTGSGVAFGFENSALRNIDRCFPIGRSPNLANGWSMSTSQPPNLNWKRFEEVVFGAHPMAARIGSRIQRRTLGSNLPYDLQGDPKSNKLDLSPFLPWQHGHQ